ncbi:MAG: InlB B-repeat-containing protein, partial [Olsenella sp.]|nr:InlB B-repeat-containing protein [Olsenella sp.]
LTTADERREAVSLGNGQAMVGLRAKADASGRKPTGPALDLSGDVRDGRLTLYAQWAETAPAGARDASATTGGDAPAEVVPGGRQETEAAEVAPADGTGENGGGSATGELDGRASAARAAAVENHQPAAVDDKDSECESPVPDSRQEPSSDETFGIQGVVPPTPAAPSETEEMRGVTEGDSAAALASAGMPNLLAASLMLRATANSGGNIVAVGRYWKGVSGSNILHALSRDGAGLEGYIREHTYYFRDSGSTPIYEARNPYTEDRYYTPSWDEYQALVGAGWVGNGVVFYGGETDVVPVYRVKVRDFDGTGYNLFTPSELESRVAGEFVGIKFYAAAYYVAYDANGGSPTPGTESVAYGENLTVSNTRPTKAGWTFQSWGGYAPGSTVRNLTQWDGATVTLRANWSPNSVRVTFDGNGGTIARNGTQTFTSGRGQSFADTGAWRTGYTLLGWADSAGATSAQYPTFSGVSDSWIAGGGSRTLYAVWQRNDYVLDVNPDNNAFGTSYESGARVKSFDVYRNGALVANSVSDYYISDAHVSDTFEFRNIRYRDGYRYRTYDLPNYVSGGVWDWRTGGWADDGGSVIKVTMGGNDLWLGIMTELNSFTNAIDHWAWGFANGEGNNEPARTAFNLARTTWAQAFGSSFAVGADRSVGAPNGFALRGTFGSSSVDGAWGSYPMGASVTQKAAGMSFEYDYDPVSYKISYDLNGGAGGAGNPTSYNVLYAADFTVAPTRLGYTFEGWYVGGRRADGINVGANARFASADDLYAKCASRTTGDVTATARWRANAYTVRYDGNGATGGSTASSSHTYDAAKALTANGFTRKAHDFVGWNTRPDGSGTSYADGASVRNLTATAGGTVTLYAQWRAYETGGTTDPR